MEPARVETEHHHSLVRESVVRASSAGRGTVEVDAPHQVVKLETERPIAVNLDIELGPATKG